MIRDLMLKAVYTNGFLPCRLVLVGLLTHLHRVMGRSDQNKVVPNNLGVVIGPSLRWSTIITGREVNSNPLLKYSWWPSGNIKKKDLPENMNLLINVMRFVFSNIRSLDLLM